MNSSELQCYLVEVHYRFEARGVERRILSNRDIVERRLNCIYSSREHCDK